MQNNSPRRIKIVTKNRYLYQKLYLELSSGKDFEICDEDAEAVLCDIDTSERIDGGILMSYTDESADILLPARLGKIREMLAAKSARPLFLIDNERCAVFHGKKIKLTELEYSLLSLLYKRGDFVSREEILDTVWHNSANSGIINVYVHYLREKLEAGGEKLIISSRKSGYKISEKYSKEASENA